ncbi:MAG: hypothetical protein LIO46_00335 [Clostridiales bacterium]|nr:hypothetical protein [Clostridiales bacterium]
MRAEDVKKEAFYNKSYAELYRYLIALGLDAVQEQSGRPRKPPVDKTA